MQSRYISKLMELAQQDNKVCHLLADSGTNFDVHFKRNFPDRIFNFGIAEQNTIGIAAGLAFGGKMPFVFLQGAFIVYRAMEFVRDDICFQNANVKLIGQGSGVSLPGLGPTHHTSEDIAILRALPNIKVYTPATPIQVAVCTQELYDVVGPCYMRIEMNHEKEFFDEDYVMPQTGQDVMTVGDDVAIFTYGSILEEVMQAAEMLQEEGILASVVNVVRMKPFDESNIIKLASKVKKIVTAEEHQANGGLGSIVADVLAKHGIGMPLLKIGFNDAFAKGYAPTQRKIRIENELDAKSIRKRVADELSK